MLFDIFIPMCHALMFIFPCFHSHACTPSSFILPCFHSHVPHFFKKLHNHVLFILPATFFSPFFYILIPMFHVLLPVCYIFISVLLYSHSHVSYQHISIPMDSFCLIISIPMSFSKELTRTSASKEYYTGSRLAHVELAERFVLINMSSCCGVLILFCPESIG